MRTAERPTFQARLRYHQQQRRLAAAASGIPRK
jgi:hypothetical protein